mmetsp:Transcript_1127/g.1245  ORF Transcript_1127/g.1245 Transcript_1127/m.1245 type:complete len:483 (-) Transcript_1127:2752-4200(-)
MPIKESNSSLVAKEANALKAQNPDQDDQEPNTNGKNIAGKLDPQKLFDLVSKNYDTWLQVMSKQFRDEENFLPFPKDESMDKNSQPIFNYTLLEALEKASSDFSEKMNDINIENEKKEVPRVEQSEDKSLQTSHEVKSLNVEKPSSTSCESLLKESEINFLRNKITQMIASNNFSINNYKAPKREGFSLYDTQDEEGLHDGNTDQFYDDEQDDYDLEEVQGDFLYDYPGQRHIEVELNTAPECETHGFEECDCPIFHAGRGNGYTNGSYGFDEDEDGPSCEFTFEYDHKGKLVPTYSNVEEKLRLMNLESRISTNSNRKNLQLPSINEINASASHNASNSSSKSKKKNKKKKRTNSNTTNSRQSKATSDSFTNTNVHSNTVFGSCCLFCEYEVIYGTKPRQMIKWYDQRVQKEEQRRLEIKTKLENAKLRALRKQRELRQKQLQQNSLEHPPSHTKAEDTDMPNSPKDQARLDNLEGNNSLK